jgi:hypothetical protein
MPDGKIPRVPPHIAWPLFVALLLAMSVGLGVTAVVAANSDGGAQLVDGYGSR